MIRKTIPAMLVAMLLLLSPFRASAAPLVIPQKQAAHFCRLMVFDEGALSLLSLHAHRLSKTDDGQAQSLSKDLTAEQIFAGYVLLADGWQTMRLFPHREGGMVSWYSATDRLPSSIGSEHQKYIREVFPRLVAEVQAGHWSLVDAYIDRLIRYQCQFGGKKMKSPSTKPPTATSHKSRWPALSPRYR